jgi:hypothetical protein
MILIRLDQRHTTPASLTFHHMPSMSRNPSHLRTSSLKAAPPPPPDADVIDLTAQDSEDEVEEHLLVEHPQPPRMRNPGKRDGLHAASAWTSYHHDAGPAVSVNAVYQCSYPWKTSPACEHVYASSKVDVAPYSVFARSY